MVKKVYQNNRYQSSFIKYVADTAEDVKKIRVTSVHMGSEVYVIDTKKTYILDSKGIWHSKADDDTITCDCVEESTVWEDLPEPKN